MVRGKAFTADQIDAPDNSKIEKLYARYEARLVAAMTKTLGYAGIAAMFLPIENQPRLIADLEGDPFVGHALSSATCELYHRYGMFLAPLTAALTTFKHCQFGHYCPVRVHDGGDEAGEPRDGEGASTESSRVTEKVKDPKKWQPSVPALPPERQSKKNFSSCFQRPRNHFSPLPPPSHPRRACQYSSKGGGPSGFPAGTP